MTIEDIKKELINLDDKEIKELYDEIAYEKSKRTGFEKGDLMLYSSFRTILFDGLNINDDFKSPIARDLEKSVICICDYIIGNYKLVLRGDRKTKTTYRSSYVTNDLSKDYPKYRRHDVCLYQYGSVQRYAHDERSGY